MSNNVYRFIRFNSKRGAVVASFLFKPFKFSPTTLHETNNHASSTTVWAGKTLQCILQQ